MSVIIDADITHIRDMNEGVVSSIKLAKYTGKGDPISTGISDPIRRAQANQRPISIPMMAIYTILDFSLAEISRSYKGNSTYWMASKGCREWKDVKGQNVGEMTLPKTHQGLWAFHMFGISRFTSKDLSRKNVMRLRWTRMKKRWRWRRTARIWRNLVRSCEPSEGTFETSTQSRSLQCKSPHFFHLLLGVQKGFSD